MFTGIIEALGEVVSVEQMGSNLRLTMCTPISKELKIDQSLAHNGVCLTVVEQQADTHAVDIIKESLDRSNLGALKSGDKVNLERAMQAGARLDGHIVQGHVDQTGTCTAVKAQDGSWVYRFEYDASLGNPVVEKGSICINGVSLTVVDAGTGSFSVAIIPYTYEHTNFHQFEVGSIVNLEFDIIGKYVAKLMEGYRNSEF